MENFTFTHACLLGAILSATDPVAVVALLKELGASKRLSTLIEGESLVNDGTAMVMYLVVYDFTTGTNPTAGEIVVKFTRLTICGPLIGLAFGIVCSAWIARIQSKPVLETNLTVLIPYVCFFTSEHPGVGGSGILAIVVLGLYMSHIGKTSISPKSEETVHAVWSYIGFLAETSIFLLAGLIMAANSFKYVTFEEVWKCIALYLLLTVIRFVCVLLFYPLLKLSGYTLGFN